MAVETRRDAGSESSSIIDILRSGNGLGHVRCASCLRAIDVVVVVVVQVTRG